MIANVSPSINTFDDTYNTLKYHINNYENIINQLKEENARLKNELFLREDNNTLFNNRNFPIGSNNIRTIFTEENKSNNDYSILSTINNFENGNSNNNKLNEIKFNNIKNEMKKYCEQQLDIKQKLISYQTDLNKIKDNQSTKEKI